MASKLRSIARACARKAMLAEGQTRLNKPIPGFELPAELQRRRHRQRRGSTLPAYNTRFSLGWREGLQDHINTMQAITDARETAEAAKARRKAKRKATRQKRKEALA